MYVGMGCVFWRIVFYGFDFFCYKEYLGLWEIICCGGKKKRKRVVFRWEVEVDSVLYGVIMVVEEEEEFEVMMLLK